MPFFTFHASKQMSDWQTHFIGEAITVAYDQPPVYSKRPDCPTRFTWYDETFVIVEMLERWQDYGRRGRMAQNMQPEHLARAAERGSWGVGRFYFRVQVADGRVFEFYYDRAPKNADDRHGAWFLSRELVRRM